MAESSRDWETLEDLRDSLGFCWIGKNGERRGRGRIRKGGGGFYRVFLWGGDSGNQPVASRPSLDFLRSRCFYWRKEMLLLEILISKLL
jgi:hypothetical protein